MHAPHCRKSGTPSRSATSVSVCRSWSASDVEPVDFNLIDQRRARNPELVGRSRAVAAMEPEGLLDVQALHLSERLGLVAPFPPTPTPTPTPAPSASPTLPQVGRQVLDADLGGPAGQDHRSLNHVP